MRRRHLRALFGQRCVSIVLLADLVDAGERFQQPAPTTVLRLSLHAGHSLSIAKIPRHDCIAPICSFINRRERDIGLPALRRKPEIRRMEQRGSRNRRHGAPDICTTRAAHPATVNGKRHIDQKTCAAFWAIKVHRSANTTGYVPKNRIGRQSGPTKTKMRDVSFLWTNKPSQRRRLIAP